MRLPPPLGDDATDALRASLMAVLIVSAPFTMVKISIFSFLIGLVIYQGCTWTRALDSDAGIGASRNVFITLVVGVGFCMIFFIITFAAKDIETLMRTGTTKLDEEEEVRGVRADGGTPFHTTQGPSSQPQHNRASSVSSRALANALNAAAKAHAECAAADRRVAELLRSTATTHADEPPSVAIDVESIGAAET